MGNSNPERTSRPSPMETRYFRSSEAVYKAILIPEGFSMNAIRVILYHMLSSSNPNRGIAFIPRDSETGTPELITPEALEGLEPLSPSARMRLIDIKTTRIKQSLPAVIVERITD